jgi:MFS family permease
VNGPQARRPIRLGLRPNLPQFTLLVAVNALVGAMVGLERSVLPLVGRQDFGLASTTAVLSFIAAFGVAKSLTNLGAGALADRIGRRRLLVGGWALALPVPVLIGAAPDWSWIVAANLILGVNQGLTWSMTVVMKVDLVGDRRRGLALGLNEAAGYGGVALAAALSGWLAATIAPREVVVTGGFAVAVVGLLVCLVFVRDTAAHVRLEQAGTDELPRSPSPSLRAAIFETFRRPTLRACSQAGLVNNLNDGLVWGVMPLFLAAGGAGVGHIGLVAGVYSAVWGLGQIWTGHWSDRVGRKGPIAGGMLVQAAALVLLAASQGSAGAATGAAVLLGAGTALVYPTLIAAVSDAVSPVARAPAIGVYRFWRDAGYVAAGLLSGAVADAVGLGSAILVVAGLTAISGVVAFVEMSGGRESLCSHRHKAHESALLRR